MPAARRCAYTSNRCHAARTCSHNIPTRRALNIHDTLKSMPKIGTYRESENWNANYDSNTCKPRSTSPSKTQTRLTNAASVSTFLNRSLFSRIAYLSLSTHLAHPILRFQRCLYLPMRCSYMSQCNDSKHHRIDSHICMQTRLVVPCAPSSVLRPHASHQSEPTF